MKKIILLLSVAVLGFSCSDDDDESSNSSSDLTGTWLLTSRSSEIEDVEPLDDCEKTSYYKFSLFESQPEFEYEYYEGSSVDDCSFRGANYEVAYEIVDNKIIIEDEIDRDSFGDVKIAVSGNSLTLTFTRTEDFFDVGSGETVEESYEEVEVYTKAN